MHQNTRDVVAPLTTCRLTPPPHVARGSVEAQGHSGVKALTRRSRPASGQRSAWLGIAPMLAPLRRASALATRCVLQVGGRGGGGFAARPSPHAAAGRGRRRVPASHRAGARPSQCSTAAAWLTRTPPLQSRGISASPSARAGLGQPVGTAGPATSALPDEHELIWDDGSKHPEPCLDNPAPMLSTETTALWLAGGFAVFGAVAAAAAYNDKVRTSGPALGGRSRCSSLTPPPRLCLFPPQGEQGAVRTARVPVPAAVREQAAGGRGRGALSARGCVWGLHGAVPPLRVSRPYLLAVVCCT